jgi:hypothetical protein
VDLIPHLPHPRQLSKWLNKENRMTISKKDQLTYWSSEAFLNQYFQMLEFDEPYSKAYGSIALGWVTNPWRQHIKAIIFKYVKSYIRKYKELPKGQHCFEVNWKTRKPKWLVDCLKTKQIVTFPKILED